MKIDNVNANISFFHSFSPPDSSRDKQGLEGWVKMTK